MREGRVGNQYKPGGKKWKRFTPRQRRFLLKKYEMLEQQMKFGQREIEGDLADKYKADIRTIQRNLKKARQERGEGSPRLRIQSSHVDLFTDGIAVARYAWLEVTVEPKIEAMDCSAWVKVLPSGAFLPLHWRGTTITAEETSAPRTTIHPEKAGQLDVALALPPPGGTVGPFPNAVFSGDVTMYLRGLYGPPWNGRGCWLAQPLALNNPNPGLEAYLSPGEHKIRVSVGCESGESDSRDFVLRSPASWEELALTAVPGATHK